MIIYIWYVTFYEIFISSSSISSNCVQQTNLGVAHHVVSFRIRGRILRVFQTCDFSIPKCLSILLLLPKGRKLIILWKAKATRQRSVVHTERKKGLTGTLIGTWKWNFPSFDEIMTNQRTNQPTNRTTNQQTDMIAHREDTLPIIYI